MTHKPITKDEFLEALKCWDADREQFSEESEIELDALDAAIDQENAVGVLAGGIAECLRERMRMEGAQNMDAQLIIQSSILAGIRFGVDMMRKLYETRELERMLAAIDMSVK